MFNNYSIKKAFYFVYNFIIVITPIVLFILPVKTFDYGNSVCLSKSLAGIECYACGMTRATMHLIHFDLLSAWEFNKLSFIVVPMLFPFWLKSLFLLFNKPLPNFLQKL